MNIHWKDWCWSWILWPPDEKRQHIGKGPDAGKDWRQEEKGVTEGETVGWHHRLNGHESEQAPEDSEGQGSEAYMLQSMGLQRVGNDWATEQQDQCFSNGVKDNFKGKKKIANLQRPQLLQNTIKMNYQNKLKKYKAKLSLLGSINTKLLSNNYKSF